jgi:hypothetical protein
MTDIELLARVNGIENRCIKLEELVSKLISLYNMHGHVKPLTEPDWQLQRVESITSTKGEQQ